MYVVEPSTDISGRPLSYAFRPSAFGPLRTFTLSGDGIDWVVGIQSGHIPYRNIRRLRMSFRPTSMQPRRFVVELWGEGAPKLQIASSTWKSITEQERLDQSYSAFVQELHSRISNAAGSARFLQGSSPLVYWPSLVVFVVVALGLAALVVRALRADTLSGAALVAAFLALFVWQGGNFIRRNRPRAYRADALPKDVMPIPR
jgi:hypothetical protein